MMKAYRMAAAMAVVAWLACPAIAGDAKVVLRTETPEEMLVGTPPDVLVMLFPGLEKPPEGKLPDLLVPAGTVNLSRKKKVTASDPNPVLGELAFVTDGKKQGTEDNYVELAPLQQWVQIDLEKPCRIHALHLWHFFREARSYHDVIVQVAADSAFTAEVRTVYSNDQDNSAKMGVGKERPYIETNLGKLIDAKGITGRYVRLYSHGNTANDLNHYVEVDVFGEPAS